jgi:hypothetical protein
MTTTPTSGFAAFFAAMTGLDGSVAPPADPNTYSWPDTAEDATAVRVARASIANGLDHQKQANQMISGLGFMKATHDHLWIAEQTAAQMYSDRAVLLLALVKVDPVYADKVARDV